MARSLFQDLSSKKSVTVIAVVITMILSLLQIEFLLPGNISDMTNIVRSVITMDTDTITIDTWLDRVKNSSARKPDVLFLIADDMRAEIGAYIHRDLPWLEPSMKTPNLDALAHKSLLFRRAYCQFAWCNPSRSSFLTSRRPDTTRVFNNTVLFRRHMPDVVTLPQYFKENGYQSHGMGKIYHLMNQKGDMDEPRSWSGYMLRVRKHEIVPEDSNVIWHAVDDNERQGLPLQDEKVTEVAINTLRDIATARAKGSKDDSEAQKPFFLAVGMKKPHLNWHFPTDFQDYYPLDNISMPINPTASAGLPDVAWYPSNELRYLKAMGDYRNTWSRTNPLPDQLIREFRMAYYTCISFIDHLMGQILRELESLGLSDNTIVVFIGDHGFHLGEHSIVGKNTAFEVTNHSPMMIHVPGVTDTGTITDSLVEFVDIYPTVAELAGLPSIPYCPAGDADSRNVKLCTEGTSLVPLFRKTSPTTWKQSAFYQYPHLQSALGPMCMGYSIRTQQYRYTQWILYDYIHGHSANWSHVCAKELYDHHTDPHEMTNLADNGQYKDIVMTLTSQLQSGWHKALPD